MTLLAQQLRARRRAIVVLGLVVVIASGLSLWLGPGPAAHHVTRFMAVKIAVTHLLQPDEYERAHVEAKLVRQWQLTLVSRNDSAWSNDLVWLVLVPGGHFAASGACCSPPPTFSWNIAITKDDAGGAGLDGVIAGSPGDGPLWYRLLPDLSSGQ